MKRCPICARTFADIEVYCSIHGTPLSVIATPLAPQNPDAPGNIETPGAKAPRGPLFYILMGAALSVVISGACIMFLGSDPVDGTTGNQNTDKSANNKTGDGAVTESEARDTLKRWLDTQNSKDFSQYTALYADDFTGEKVTNSGSFQRMDRGEWIRDKKKQWSTFLDVAASSIRISIEDDTATVVFNQKWRSVRYCDRGEKEIVIRRYGERLLIRSEKLKYAVNCSV